MSDPTRSVSIDRTSLGQDPLVITDGGFGTYLFTPEGLGQVSQSVRATYAQSEYLNGSVLLRHRREATSLPLEFHITGETYAEVQAARQEMDDALYRRSYPVIWSVDGVTQTYMGGPALLAPSRTSVLDGISSRVFDTFTVTIPFPSPYPVGGA